MYTHYLHYDALPKAASQSLAVRAAKMWLANDELSTQNHGNTNEGTPARTSESASGSDTYVGPAEA